MPPRVRSPGLKPRPVYTRDTRPADTPMPPTVQRYRTSSSPRISSGSRSRPMTSCATNQMMATRPHNATATSHKAAATVPSHAPPPPVCASAIPTHRAISPFKRPAARHSSRRTGPCSAARPPWRTARVSLASSMVRVDPLPDASHSFAAPPRIPHEHTHTCATHVEVLSHSHISRS